jgi:predicted Fe-S protein YdhL (DUF1289 family)
MTIASPCISQGCRRTIEEIIAWSSMEDGAKQQVWLLIEQRKEQRNEQQKISTTLPP